MIADGVGCRDGSARGVPRTRPEAVVAAGGPLRLAAADLPAAAVGLAWLGQAGFLVRAAGLTILVDPYLSDFLAEKYRGQEFPHVRLVPAPLAVGDLPRLDLVLCTHGHSDHMDPETLVPIAARHPGCRFVVPASETDRAAGLGLPVERLLPIDAGDSLAPAAGLAITAVPAAHETLERDAAGRCRFLGYVLQAAGLAVYHSGDTVVFPELPGLLGRLGVDVALLPVNGRDAFRAARGVPGNMTAAEAIGLCRTAGVPLLVPHHFGMFAFNTATAADIKLLRATAAPRTVVPDCDYHLVLSPARPSPEARA